MLTKKSTKDTIMKRRKFLILGSVFGLCTYAQAREISDFEKAFKKIESTLSAVQEHMFPEKSKLPSAKSMNAIQFLFETMSHKSFDKDIRVFVLEGAKELEIREKVRFSILPEKEKEKALREYEKTNYGSSWLSHMMTLTMEGLFSDPIYGSNVKERGWESLHVHGGHPGPKTRYMES